jgi:hypothetical protein
MPDPAQTRTPELERRTRNGGGGKHPIVRALVSGAAGAVALTAIHQLASRYVEDAPRMDVVGMRAIARGLLEMGVEPPAGERLYQTTLAGDLVSNTLYYSAVCCGGRAALETGTGLGLAAGVGALVLPPVMGLGAPPHSDTWSNRIMTVAWYTLGGVVAGATWRALRRRA